MAMDFSLERWEKVKADTQAWWAGELDRPLIQVRVTGRDPGRPAPKLSRVSRGTTSYDLSVTPDQIIDRWDYDLSGQTFLGDAFPSVWVDFGPGVIAAFMGARPEPGSDTVWFHPARDQEIPDIEFHYDPQNPWLARVKAISRTAMERWRGLVQVGMTDLGGNLDILSTFRPSENLLLDLYDHPDHVKRLTWQAHDIWWRCFQDIDSALRPLNPGYTAWAPIFSPTPSYMLQCDFCYMLSPAMFDEFVKPELAASCRRLGNAFYHLDGPGELPHLDSLLEIKELKGVQWVPGAGQRDLDAWPEVYRKIRKAGKLIEIWGSFRTMDTIVEQLGSARGIVFHTWIDQSRIDEAMQFLRKHRAR